MIIVMRMTANFAGVDIKSILSFFGETVQRGKKNLENLHNIKMMSKCKQWFIAYLMLNVTMSSSTLCVTYLESFFSSIPFLCNVAMKSVNGRDIRNCSSIMRPANINGPCNYHKIIQKCVDCQKKEEIEKR